MKNFKTIKIKTIIVFAIILAMIIGMFQINVFASEMSTYDKNRMLGATARHWHGTSLREWLNSDKQNVNYTSLPPTYSEEAGFLSSQNFTTNELNGIAVTKHGAGWQYSMGNRSKTDYYSQKSVAHNSYIYNDKVFILHYTDLLNYIERNNILQEHKLKYYSDYLQSQLNRTSKYDYLVNSGYYNSGYVGTSVLYTSTFRQVYTRSANNIAPALTLKPEHTLSNGVKAKNLTVGSTVNFGKYKNDDIEWIVLTKTPDGHALLWSTKILTVKEYDAPGDINQDKSDYINYPTAEVDILDGITNGISHHTKTRIKSVPTIKFLNPEALTTPVYGESASAVLKIKATDSVHGVKNITLPNGEVVNGDYAEWEITKNGEYDIVVENNIGIISVQHVVTKVINTPATVDITTNKDESTKWTNKPVTVNISSSNQGVYELFIPASENIGYGRRNSGSFPSWMSLGGKRLRVTGTLKNEMSDNDALVANMDAGIRIRLSYTYYNSSRTGPTYPIFANISMRELKEKGEITFDEIYTIPDNVYSGYRASINFMDGNSAYMKPPYNYSISDFKFELIDKDDLEITEITMPDGSKVYDNKASYVIDKNGSYTFTAKDNRGDETVKTIDLAIDTVKPIISISGASNEYTDFQTLRINATDNSSGIKSLRLPNGEVRYNTAEGQPKAIDYNITSNGLYTFVARDFAGNQVTKSIRVSNIDEVKPTVTHNLSTSAPTNKNITVTINTIDNESGIKSIKLPNGNIVNKETTTYSVASNGSYLFEVEDKAKNIIKHIVTVTNIDKINPDKPTVSANKTNLTNQDVTVSAVFSDDSSIKQYRKNNNTWNNYTSSIIFTTNGKVDFRGQDNAGNWSNITTYEISNIDKVAPEQPLVSIENNKVSYEKYIIASSANITATDFSRIEYKKDSDSWKTYTDKLLVDDGTTSYQFRSVDVLGNKSVPVYKTVNVDYLSWDDVAPNVTLIASTTNNVNTDITVTAMATDDFIGIKSIELPDGTVVNNSNASYIVKTNGTYEFIVKDKNDNMKTQYITINNIDKIKPIAPQVTITTKDTLNLSGATDEGFGVDYIQYQLNDGEWTTYEASVWLTDNDYAINVRTIDTVGNISDIDTNNYTIYKEQLVLATSLVNTANTQLTQESVDNAKVAINKLPNTAFEKVNLLADITTIQGKVTLIRLNNIMDDFITTVENKEMFNNDMNTVKITLDSQLTQLETTIGNLPSTVDDSRVKERLININKIVDTGLSLMNAESDFTTTSHDATQTLLATISNQIIKDNFYQRLDEVDNVISARAKVSESLKPGISQTYVDDAWDAISLVDGDKNSTIKNELVNQLIDEDCFYKVAVESVDRAEKYETRESIVSALSKVKQVSDNNPKKVDTDAKATTLKDEYNESLGERILQRYVDVATHYTEKAEKFTTNYYNNRAVEYINKIPDSPAYETLKKELRERISVSLDEMLKFNSNHDLEQAKKYLRYSKLYNTDIYINVIEKHLLDVPNTVEGKNAFIEEFNAFKVEQNL